MTRSLSLGLTSRSVTGCLRRCSRDSTRLDESEQRLVEVLAGNFASVLDTLVRQDELFEERERFQLLTESIEEYAFLVVDDDGTIQTWNSGAETLFGYDADTAVGMSMGQLHRESDRESGVPDRLLQQARIGSESSHEAGGSARRVGVLRRRPVRETRD
ncbi:hypothetical protein C9J85_18930 [Haloferax sp. wsp5]|nr:hypothetical protein C9J85_18930 [Haloferax sp. wsp5]